MTLIIGIKCQGGIVIGGDGTATYGANGQPTIRQSTCKKLRIIDSQVVIGTSGPVGLGQRFAGTIEQMWKAKQLGGGKTPAQLMFDIRQAIWPIIGFELDVARGFAQFTGGLAIQKVMSSTLLAIPIARAYHLFQFDEQGAPEEATDDLPFTSIGSGQLIADPFLAFLRRVLWPGRLPTVHEGVMTVVWTLHHANQTHPGGVGGQMQIITLEDSGKVEQLSEPQITGENLEAIKSAEDSLAEAFANKMPGTTVPAPEAS